MQLISVEFALFFLAVLVACRSVWDKPGWRKLCLLAASLVFYSSIHAGFTLLLLAVSLTAFAAAKAVAAATSPVVRKTVMTLFLAVVLGDLCLFKYYGLFYDLAGSRLGLVDLNLALPVGISFFTFQAIGYVVDAYRDKDAARFGLLDVLVFMAFFPTVLSGPILRAGVFIPQLEAPRPAWTDESQAFWLIVLGLFKKVTLSSYLSEHVTRHFLSAPDSFSSAGALFGALAYSAQIYCDFSGYSDLAQGLSGLLGLSVPDNFKSPYKARNLREFWQGWHVSLSTWLRDYLYIPLGGGRCKPARGYANLMLTMGLGGLWHGASLNFLVWGLLHGLGLCATHALSGRLGPTPGGVRGLAVKTLCWAGTFGFVTLAWVFFAAADSGAALAAISRIMRFDPAGTGVNPVAATITVCVVGVQALRLEAWRLRPAWFSRLPAPALGLAVGALATLAVRLGPDGMLPFIYFSF